MTMTEATIVEMIALCKERVETAKHTAVASNHYFLVSPGGTMVIWRKDDGVFLLTASRADTGYTFANFITAKRAARRWNEALTPQQKDAKCQVHACSHAQYLEYIITNGEKLLAMLQSRTQQ